MPLHSFVFASPGIVVFEPGAVKKLGAIARGFGNHALVVRAGHFAASEQWNGVGSDLNEKNIEFHTVDIHGEPSPELVDDVVAQYVKTGIKVVIAVGGGSVIDAGKAISAMLPLGESVVDYLEDTGKKAHPGEKIPFVAIPTTAGTGSEASANAVLSRIGVGGFKKSLRHQNLIPDAAVVDPELALSCPAAVTAACGMDAFTQLLESYVSPAASPMTDALVESALPQVRECLIAAVTNGSENLPARTGMAYAALISGIALANAGLGAVHGMASPVGAYFSIPHGVVCGTLLGKTTEVTITTLQKCDPQNLALKKYARAGNMISGKKANSVAGGCSALLKTINSWIETLELPRLSDYGITVNDIEKIAAGTANKNNPIKLSSENITEILLHRL